MRLDGVAVLPAAGLLLAAGWWRLLSGRLLADRVIDPRSGREPFHVPAWVPILIRFGPLAILLAAVGLVVTLH
jgi:hypothetical protein